MTKTLISATAPSQANSVFSEEMGSVAVVDTRAVVIEEPSTVHVASSASESEREEAVELTKDMALNGGGGESDRGEFADSAGGRVSSIVRLNPKASNSGRQQVDRRVCAPEDEQERVRFNAELRMRSEIGEVTLVQLADSLDLEKLSPH